MRRVMRSLIRSGYEGPLREPTLGRVAAHLLGMARTGNRIDFSAAEDRVGNWLGNNGRVVIPIVLAVIVVFGVVLEFV